MESGAHGLRVVAANESARLAGVSEGLRFTDARARLPSIDSEEIDRAADSRALHHLGDWMIRIAPLVALDGDDGLMIETTGCAHLYGGEAAMVQSISQLLYREGIEHRLGLASTPGAAGAIARARSGVILPDGDEADGLADLPVAVLRVSEKAETLLRRFGLTRIGQLYGLDRKSLTRRFHSREAADAVVLRLDQALGLRREPLTPLRPPPDYAARLPCPEPLLSTEGLVAGLEKLASQLCEDLKTLGQGAREFTLFAYRCDGDVKQASIRLARPSSDSIHLQKLFANHMERIDPGFGIDFLTLEARHVGRLNLSVRALSGALAVSDVDEVSLAALSDRISAKLGIDSVQISQPHESYFPERSEHWKSFEGELPETAITAQIDRLRPIRLFDHPEPLEVLAQVPDGGPQRFYWRRILRVIAWVEGPERMAPEWWRYTAPPAAAPSPEGSDRKWLAPRADPRADAQIIARARKEAEAAIDESEHVVRLRPSAFSAGLTREPASKLLELVVNACDEVKEREQIEQVWLRQAEMEDARRAEMRRHMPRARDYYRVEDERGGRYWIFREGLYDDGRGGLPQWFIHGVFA